MILHFICNSALHIFLNLKPPYCVFLFAQNQQIGPYSNYYADWLLYLIIMIIDYISDYYYLILFDYYDCT